MEADLSKNFYKDLLSFNTFNGVFNLENYKNAPEDWLIVISDIKGSTEAIGKGKYKDVNLIGAGCIAAIKKLGAYPFVFGGDGASFLIPPTIKDIFINELQAIQNSARDRFNLDLRIGVVPVRDVLKESELKVAKFEITKNTFVAKFAGGGLELADSMIKNNPNYIIKSAHENQSSFDGLSCRWKPIESTNGMILTLIVKSSNFSLYKSVQAKIDKIVGEDDNDFNPLKIDTMKYLPLFTMFRQEKDYEKTFLSKGFVSRYIEIIFAYLIFKVFRKIQPKFFRDYSESMKAHSDFRKFDDCLRMVIDCSHADFTKIISELRNIENIKFGFHCSHTALMTCLVEGLKQGEHIHFIDGGDGGYTSAAAMLKREIISVNVPKSVA